MFLLNAVHPLSLSPCLSTIAARIDCLSLHFYWPQRCDSYQPSVFCTRCYHRDSWQSSLELNGELLQWEKTNLQKFKMWRKGKKHDIGPGKHCHTELVADFAMLARPTTFSVGNREFPQNNVVVRTKTLLSPAHNKQNKENLSSGRLNDPRNYHKTPGIHFHHHY